eukprot:XP_011677630.1 PREDICTED: RNA-directed DNA polymerase from mobile element jockey-like [Strongylocentrotus purpuratus]
MSLLYEEKSFTPAYAFFKGKYEQLREYVEEHHCFEWTEEYVNLEEKYACFEKTIIELTKKFVPLRLPGLKARPQWMNSEVKKAVRRKHSAWNKHLRARRKIPINPVTVNQTREEYNAVRNLATSATRSAKGGFELKISKDVKKNPKSVWKYIQSKLKVKSAIENLCKPDGSIAESDNEKAELLNNYFCSVFTKENLNNIPELQGRDYSACLEDMIIHREKIHLLIEKMDQTKSAGPDGIHIRILKELKLHVIDCLAEIFNESMSTGCVPKSWKSANVVPLFKKGKKSDPGNYRPISLTSVIGKIMETVVRDEIVEHLESNDLITKHQHGFRKGHSCSTQLLEVTNDWTKYLDTGNNIDCIYLDYRKAFDSVPHARLIKKLQAYGIRGKVWKWISNFLSDRSQQVIVNGSKSSSCLVTSGIPQGSVLGPVLFTIFINDIPDSLSTSVSSTVKLFADDTKLYSPVNSLEDSAALQHDLDLLAKWTDKWQLPRLIWEYPSTTT